MSSKKSNGIFRIHNSVLLVGLGDGTYSLLWYQTYAIVAPCRHSQRFSIPTLEGLRGLEKDGQLRKAGARHVCIEPRLMGEFGAVRAAIPGEAWSVADNRQCQSTSMRFAYLLLSTQLLTFARSELRLL
jgi:hypothetical protein